MSGAKQREYGPCCLSSPSACARDLADLPDKCDLYGPWLPNPRSASPILALRGSVAYSRLPKMSAQRRAQRRYLAADVARVAGLAATGMTHKAIAAETGIPRRSVSSILERHPVAQVVTAATKEQVSAALWSVVSAGTNEALRRIGDPNTRAGELAQLIKVAADQYALLTGGPTQNVNVKQTTVDTYGPLGIPPNTRRVLVDWLREVESLPDEDLELFNGTALNIMENIRRAVLDDDEPAALTASAHAKAYVRDALDDIEEDDLAAAYAAVDGEAGGVT